MNDGGHDPDCDDPRVMMEWSLAMTTSEVWET